MFMLHVPAPLCHRFTDLGCQDVWFQAEKRRQKKEKNLDEIDR
jgi:hypothetical protein